MAWLNKVSSWLVTKSGRKFSYLATGTLATGVIAAQMLPHTILVDKYMDVLHLYNHGFSVPLGEKLHQRFQKALDLLEMEEEYRKLYVPFAAYGFDLMSIGSSYSKFGVRVGLPANFFYEREKDVDKQFIKLRDESIVWDLVEGQLLLKSLVLSEKAQLFAMAREIKMRDSPKHLFDTIISVTSTLGAYGLSRTINERHNFYERPRILRLGLYCLVGLFAFGSYIFMKDYSQVYLETKIDKELKEKNPIFAEGGKEFYNKIVNRNLALRKLLGREGEKNWTALGNDNYLLRYAHVPVLQRKMFFETQQTQ